MTAKLEHGRDWRLDTIADVPMAGPSISLVAAVAEWLPERSAD
jgi:hypothetical protein